MASSRFLIFGGYFLYSVIVFDGYSVQGFLNFCDENEEFVLCSNKCDACNKGSCSHTLLCIPGCDCIKDHCWNEKGKCVPKKQCHGPICNMPLCKEGCRIVHEDSKRCPTCKCDVPGKCGINEKIVKCAKPRWCNTCEIRGNCKLKSCKRGCDCKPGFYRSGNGTCIEKSLCHRKEQCGPNEEYSSCVNPCNNCEIKGKCNFLVCNKGCDCKKGCYRKEGGICIPESLCPKKPHCGKNADFSHCASLCPKRCKKIDGACAAVCVDGCVCKDDLVFDDNGDCIPKEQCPKNSTDNPHNCLPEEEYYGCKPTCKNTCENYNAKNSACPLYCISGCYCKRELVLSKEGKCVEPSNCPKDAEPSNSSYTSGDSVDKGEGPKEGSEWKE